MKKSLFILLIALSGCLKEEPSKKPFISYVPKELNDGWEISAPENEGLNAQQLTDIFEEIHNRKDMWQIRSLLVFRNGKILAESYMKDDDEAVTPTLVQSCTKQVLGILTGIALEKNIIQDINDPISLYIPEAIKYNDKKNITIEQLLTMKSGIKYENGGIKGDNFDLLIEKPKKLDSYILDKPMANSPGAIARYKDCDAHLIAICIQNQVGMKTSEWAKEVLFDPLNIKHLEWLSYKDGYTLGGSGILTTPRDLAKFGQLVLDSGYYKGIQIVSKQWIKEMTTVREQNVYGTQFGYMWRLNSSDKWVMMMGHGGQLVCIVPQKNLIVVVTAEPNIQGDYQLSFQILFNYVKRIIRLSN